LRRAAHGVGLGFGNLYRCFARHFGAAGFAAFIVLGFVFRVLSNYTREGNFYYSGQNASVWTVFSVFVFVGLFGMLLWLNGRESSRRVFWLYATVLSVFYVLFFFAFYWSESKALLLTLKFQGMLLVEDGDFTPSGTRVYLAIAFLDCMFSVLSLAACFPKLVQSIDRQAAAGPS
jgi:hypothetical protein